MTRSKVKVTSPSELEILPFAAAIFFAIYSGRSSLLLTADDAVIRDVNESRSGRVVRGQGQNCVNFFAANKHFGTQCDMH